MVQFHNQPPGTLWCHIYSHSNLTMITICLPCITLYLMFCSRILIGSRVSKNLVARGALSSQRERARL